MQGSALFYDPTMGKRKLPAPDPEPFGSTDGAEFVELPIDDDWRKLVQTQLKAMRQDGKALAKHIGCTQGNISQTLSLRGKRKQRSSKFAHAIMLATGITLPPLAILHLTWMRAESSPGAAGFAKMVLGLAEQHGVRLPVTPVT